MQDKTAAHASDERQSYAEGSSLRGDYVQDKVWVSGLTTTPQEEEEYGVDFVFGCHTLETSACCDVIAPLSVPAITLAFSWRWAELFVSQVADGIMGFSRSGECCAARWW